MRKMKTALHQLNIIAVRIAGKAYAGAVIPWKVVGNLLMVLAGKAVELFCRIYQSGIVRRTLILVSVTILCVVGFLSIRGELPFMAIYGSSMQPNLQAGDLILIEDINPADVEEGDIIVFTVPSAVREYYNYPQVVAHRVLEVQESDAGVTFRTKGDNTGEDPFTVRPQDIKGHVSEQISFLGYPLLFFQSKQGTIFIIIALVLLAIYLYSREITKGRRKLHRSLFSPVLKESQEASKVLEQRMESTEKGMTDVQQALLSFSAAVTEYAEHLKSHTSAIQGLSEASQELKKGAAEQNKVLVRLMESMEQKMAVPEEEAEQEFGAETEKETGFPPGCIRNRRPSGDGDTGQKASQ